MIPRLLTAAFAAAHLSGNFQRPHFIGYNGHPLSTCSPRKRSTRAMRTALDEVERLYCGVL